VIVLDDGSVTGEGTHRELLGRDSSYQLAVAR
jgi:putative ABC transport system ATP-binding protein